MSEPLVDLVVVTYSQPNALMNFLLSLEACADVPFTLTIINNNSQHPQLTHITKRWNWMQDSTRHFFTDYRYVNQNNVGYAKACNQGAAMGSAPFIILLNDDVIFRPQCLSKLLAHYERPEYDQVAILGPRQVSSDGKLTHGGIVKRHGKDTHRYWQVSDSGQASDEMDVPTVSGSVYCIRREAWQELTDCPVYQKVSGGAEGAFLPTPHYFEETFCSYHARDHGWGIRYQGDVAFIHEWHRSSPVGGEAETKHFPASEALFRAACDAHGIELEF